MITFNGILIAIAAFMQDYVQDYVPTVIISCAIASIVILIANFYLLRREVDSKVEGLIEKLKDANNKNRQSNDEWYRRMWRFIKSTMMREIAAFAFSLAALLFIAINL